MIHIFWNLNFLCDYLSHNGLFHNSVTYQILLNKILLILTKRGSQWKQKTMNWYWDLILYSYVSVCLCLCCLLYLHCLSSVTQMSENTHWCFEINSFGKKPDLMYALHWFFELQSSPAMRQTKPSTAFLFSSKAYGINLFVCSHLHIFVYGNWNSSAKVHWLDLS